MSVDYKEILCTLYAAYRAHAPLSMCRRITSLLVDIFFLIFVKGSAVLLNLGAQSVKVYMRYSMPSPYVFLLCGAVPIALPTLQIFG